MISYLQKLSGYAVGNIVRMNLPPPLSRLSVQYFTDFYRINMSEAEKSDYRTIAELFTRKLKPTARPLGDGLVHPADAVLTQIGPIQQGQLLQIKGITYALSDLICEPAVHYESGHFLNYYLCPTDYHRVHQVDSAKNLQTKKIPGFLWPVNNWGVKNIPGLFAVNERVAMEFENKTGRFWVIMVGALNVGEIQISFQAGSEVEKGAELGVFHMGSSVAVIFDKNFVIPELSTPINTKVRESLNAAK